MAPSAGEGLRAAAVLGGEEGYDGADDGVGDAADEIVVGLVAIATAPCPLRRDSMGFTLRGRRRGLRLLHCRREMERVWRGRTVGGARSVVVLSSALKP